jgi:2Fe-2S ferredoxin
VQDDQLPKTPEMVLGEDAMLDGTAVARQSNSRLSCQLVMTPAMEGLVVTMPETQT